MASKDSTRKTARTPAPNAQLTTSTTDAGQVLRVPLESDPAKLQETIESLDQTSQDAFNKITAIANLAAASLKGMYVSGDVRHALQAISYIADDTMNSINCLAEEVGCNYNEERRDAERRVGVTHG